MLDRALQFDTAAETLQAAETPLEEQITALAYALWLERGSPEGSPEQDWYQAEQELRSR
jgi:Protein of unknown function (DUF2934)